jgi:DNA repair exonuclease SbcCD ATPase subunit
MRITDLTITNFGPHEKVTVDVRNSSIVGVSGPNGCGKSNLLAALKYGLTGATDDPAATYIRGAGVGNTAKLAAAEVTVGFVKHGRPGTIRRRMTETTSTRELVYDGQEPVTKAAAVDAAMQELLGADLNSIAIAGFIPQGDLDRLLFGKQAEREKMFMRLLGLEEMPKLGELAMAKVRVLLSGLEDIAAVKMETNETLLASQREYDELRQQLAGTLDRAPAVAAYTTLLAAWRAHGEAAARKEQAPTVDQAHVATLTATIDRLTQEQTSLSLNQQRELREKLLHLRRLKESCAQLVRAELQMSQLPGAPAAIADKRAALAAAVQAQEPARASYATIRAQLRAAEERTTQLRALEAAKLTLEEATRDHAAAEVEAQQAQAKLRELEASRDPAATAQIDLLTKGLAALRADCCPLCDAAAAQSQLRATWEAQLATLKQQTLALAQQITTAYGEVTRLQSRLNTAEQFKLGHARAVQSAQQIVDARQDVGAVDVAALESQLLTIESQGKELATRVGQLTAECQEAERAELAYRTAKLALDTARAAYPGVIGLDAAQQALKAETTLLENTEAEETQVQARITELGQAVRTASQQRAELQTALDVLHALEGAVQSALDAYMRAVPAALQVWNEQFPAGDPRQLMTFGTTELLGIQDNTLPEFQRQVQAREALTGRVAQALSQVQALQARFDELTKREQGQNRTRETVKQLNMVADAFKRAGVPMLMLRNRFDQLAELTNMALGLMESNFLVTTDPETPASFLFSRTDNAAGVTFTQTKLSGGQRVRLTIAFLLAVQQLILPDVGLLVLDEPSLHLDAASIEQLRELLDKTAAQFGGSEKQIWVCDHSPLLLPVFQSVIELRAPMSGSLR